MTRPGRAPAGVVALVVVLVGLAMAGGVATAGPAGAQDGSDADTALAEKYAPIVAVRSQPEDCGEGEPFAPAPVESVLGRADVSLLGPDGQVVTTAPTAADLFGLDGDFHLDLPGNPLDPGCDYETWWNEMAGGLRPTVYARVAGDPDHPGKLVVQYWLWWVYNDWNDKHEGDWEMLQLVFDAETAAEALDTEPSLAMFAQHEGGQYEEWDGDGLERDGDHVVVFSGEGSHAGYFSANRWFGKSGQTGFGCDSTLTRHDLLEPDVVLLPSRAEDVTGPDDPFAWLTYTGRWGEQAPSFNNGPQGPVTKSPWSHPVTWVEEEGRTSAVALPPPGSQVTDFFCGAAAAGSLLFIDVLDSPVLTITFLLLAVGVVVVGVRRTRWRPSDPLPVTTRRRAGQMFVAALRLQRRYAGLYVRLGLVVFGGGALAAVVQAVVLGFTPIGDVSSLSDESAQWAVPLALLAGAVVSIPVMAWVRASGAAVVHQLAERREPSFSSSTRQALSPSGGLLSAIVLHLVATIGAALPVLLPLTLWLLAKWAVATPTGVAEGRSMRGSLRRSGELTKGHRWRTLGVTVVANIGVSMIGPMAGTLALLFTGAGFALVNLVSGLIGMVLVPWAGTVMALLREDLVLCAEDGSVLERLADHPLGE